MGKWDESVPVPTTASGAAGPSCAHLTVLYKPIGHKNGTWSDCWVCDSCQHQFWPDTREHQPPPAEPASGGGAARPQRSDRIVWLVRQDGDVHSVHATRESALSEKGEDLRVEELPWAVLDLRGQPAKAEPGTPAPCSCCQALIAEIQVALDADSDWEGRESLVRAVLAGAAPATADTAAGLREALELYLATYADTDKNPTPVQEARVINAARAALAQSADSPAPKERE